MLKEISALFLVALSQFYSLSKVKKLELNVVFSSYKLLPQAEQSKDKKRSLISSNAKNNSVLISGINKTPKPKNSKSKFLLTELVKVFLPLQTISDPRFSQLRFMLFGCCMMMSSVASL